MKISDIINYLKPISIHLENEVEILNVRSIDDILFDANTLGWCSDKNIHFLEKLSEGTVLISKELSVEFFKLTSENKLNLIVVDNPRLSFAEILRVFFIEQPKYGQIHISVVINESVKINLEKVNIAPNVVIEKDVVIGDNVIIGANTVIKSGTIIESNTKIGSNCTIGGVGFGYEPNSEGIFELIPHIGYVILKSDVEIGNNVCIDRAVLGSTILESGVKVDNLVHIAHGVHIGENSLIIAHAMIAGSVKIGKNVWVAPCASIKQKIKIGDNSFIGLGSVVLKDVQSYETVAGVPAKALKK